MKYIFKKSLRKNLSLILLIFSALFVLQSCYPGDDLTPADTDIVATFFDQNVNFSTVMTYAIPDSILRLDSDGNPVIDPGQYDQQILNDIKSGLDGLGFTQEADPSNADVIIIPFVNTRNWVSGGCYNDWWSGYWYGWWYPYYGWCYPVYYTYQTGSIVIAMIDANSTEAKTALWVAGINGILQDSNTGIAARINQNIQQAFAQSPYLGNGK